MIVGLALLPVLMGQTCTTVGPGDDPAPTPPPSSQPVGPSPAPEPQPQPRPRIHVQPAAHSFGIVSPGNVSVAQVFEVSNVGLADLTIGQLGLTGLSPTAYLIETQNCSAQTLVPLATCTVTVTFRPVVAGRMDAQLTIASNDPVSGVVNIPLTGLAYGF
jgi:hypothetical protein